MREYGVGPVTMECRSCAPQGRHRGIADFSPRRILASVQDSLDTQALCRRGDAEETDDDLPALQGLPTPVGHAVAKHPGLDLVPLARGGHVAATAAQATLLGKALQCPFSPP